MVLVTLLLRYSLRYRTIQFLIYNYFFTYLPLFNIKKFLRLMFDILQFFRRTFAINFCSFLAMKFGERLLLLHDLIVFLST